MTEDRRFSLIKRFVAGKSRSFGREPEEARAPVAGKVVAATGSGLTGSALENAYRELMLENHVLAESNERLQERLARQESGLAESPAARQLIRAQRNALAERSHKLRELEYENQKLKRDQKKLIEENRKLAASLASHMQEIQPLLHQEEVSRRELAEAKMALRAKTNELLKLTDKYYQLKAKTTSVPPPSSAANGRF